ncbi:magnesium-dependent phosphatase-1 [Roseibacillus persicicus]|uniref:Magnesium-dependent phosphatase-1 n=1 Tax=Roseibacillus persicicus TaxID=454148 RepID=A0A918TEV4_9BACT|nr:magnesium-dependent phosphatase-1 [Roseibacillus persicicus]GHC43252.1 hypothetical protein GCM10007100_05430 [Roseibacillus persicicus]
MAQLIVFDLDLTLWHCGTLLWCDQLRPPLSQDKEGRVRDADGVEVRLYDEVPTLLENLADEGYLLALASRTSAPPIARQLLELFGIRSYFEHEEIYPGDKSTHFASLQEKTGVPYSEMLFFDDEPRNVSSVGRLGAQAVLVSSGVYQAIVSRALETGLSLD